VKKLNKITKKKKTTVFQTRAETNAHRKKIRKRLTLASIPFVILFSLFVYKTATMYAYSQEVSQLYEAEKYRDVTEISEKASEGVNIFEKWITYYNTGTGLIGEGKHKEAIPYLEKAVEEIGNSHKPFPGICSVTLNLSLAYEAWGDEIV
jgi:tetratricopeptide (TPR) repeat protein